MKKKKASELSLHFIDDGKIEVAPLAFMRGRALNSAFVILDEAQNCTKEQMKRFLTRLGFDPKVIVTADINPNRPPAWNPFRRHGGQHVPGISFVCLTDADVVRHPLVQAIVRAYDEDAKRQKSS
ncbi:MAG: hypothetical protein COV46_07165 [Deltaproteobacteria bacterium CG11_big_fil_rev_8_21_14_0_20_49_13]|nr:MAG: hypothetical protein COV46_07165 [Deltaproteobacteria bacterium CG11_big_fil_rev_8_21_14_0_20_49_13]